MRIYRTLAPFLLLAAALHAQETRGSITGTVADPQGASVVGATVIVTNTDTNTPVQLVTNNTGYYEAPLLRTGNYRVSVEAPGFKKFVRPGIVLALGARLAIDVALEVGAISDSVTVSAESPMLDTSSLSTGKVMSNRELMDLPVLTNNILIQARMANGVATTGTTQYLSEGMIGGSSTSYFAPGGVGGNEWTIDGQPNLGSGRNTAFTPQTDLVGEFKVETATFDASFGHSVGLNIAMSTKGGTNQLHGTVTEEYWNAHWNAAPFFFKQQYYQKIAAANASGNTALAQQLGSQQIMPGGHSHNFSGTLAGPVYIPKILNGKNRLFFFFSYSGARDDSPARPNDITDTVPTLPERQGDFSDLLPAGAQYTVYDPLSIKPDPARATHFVRTAFPGNIIPKTRFNNPMYDFYTSRIPAPNNNPTTPTAQPVNNFLATFQVDNNIYNAFENRIDYQVNARNRLFFRWNWSHYVEYYGDFTGTGLASTDDTRRNVSGIIDWTFSQNATTVWNFTLSANQWFQRNFNSGLIQYKPSDVGLPKYVDDQCLRFNDCSLPVVSFAGYFFYNGSSFGRALSTYPKTRSEGIKLNLTHIHGAHTIRGGIDFRGQIRNDIGFNGNSAGNLSFSNTYTQRTDDGNTPAASLGLSWAAFILGIPNGMSIDNNTSVSQINPYYAWYGQDTWRATRNLTVTLGLRMEYEMGATERYDRAITTFDPSLQLPITAAAQAAYAANPIPQVPASSFSVLGGNNYAGVNGAPRKLWQNQLMYLPRVSAAWQFNSKMIARAGYGIYYDTLNVLNESANQAGFSRTTSTTISNDFGQTFLAGDPYNGVSPVTDPFPVRADGTRFDQPYGNSLGSMYQVGRGFTFTPYDRMHPRVQKWRASLQRELSPNMSAEIAYWGQWGDDLNTTKRLDALPAQYWATGLVRNNAIATDLNSNVTNPFYVGNFAALKASNPTLYQFMNTNSFFTSTTIQKNKLLRQYPQMNGINEGNDPLGKNRIKALELNFTRRFSKGLNVNFSYTWMRLYQATGFDNEFDLKPAWYPSNNGRPQRLTLNGIYEFPFGKGRHFWKSGPLSYVFGGWQTALTYEYQPGALLSWGNNYYYGDLSTIASQLNSVPHTLPQWFNTSVPFEKNPSNTAAAFAVRVFPNVIEGVRGDKLSQYNANLRRDFKIKERFTLQLRADIINLQNRSQFNDPDTSPTSGTFGKVTSQTGSQNRFYQLQARIQF